MDRAPISVQHNRQGLRQTSEAARAMLYWLVDDIWTNFGAMDMSKSMTKKFRASWMKNSYQRLRVADLGALRGG